MPCKIKYLLYKILNKLHLKKADDYFVDYLKRARKIFKFDFACFCVNSPKINVTRWLNSKNIPYVFFMHSTWIDDPRFRSEDIYPIENEIIKGSYKYFVPSFFFKKYKNTYNHKQLQPYNLPLLIDKKDVLDAYKHQTSNKQYDFAYFGALQTFRNERKIFDIFKKMNAKIDVFCYDNFESHLAVIKHNAVSEKEFLNALSSSRFLVIFDNSAPFNHYLPSKCYTYVSFCKPIIVFGDNEKSATIDFLKDYPYYFYQKIGQDIDGLLNFINTFSSIEIEYDEKIYSKYKKYSPHDSLLNINTILMENQK